MQSQRLSPENSRVFRLQGRNRKRVDLSRPPSGELSPGARYGSRKRERRAGSKRGFGRSSPSFPALALPLGALRWGAPKPRSGRRPQPELRGHRIRKERQGRTGGSLPNSEPFTIHKRPDRSLGVSTIPFPPAAATALCYLGRPHPITRTGSQGRQNPYLVH